MTAFRRVRFATAATALVFGTGLGMPAAAATGVAGTVPAAAGSNSCTTNNVSLASDQSAEPWEIAAANPASLTSAQGEPLDGTGVRVAVIDTGVQTLPGGQLSASRGSVYTGQSGYTSDDDGHGTMVSSIIAAQAKPSLDGMQGIAPGVSLISLREAGCNAVQGDGNTEKSMAQAIEDAVRDGADVINISQDGYDPSPELEQAVTDAYQHGVLIVSSAGNQGDRDTTGDNSTDYGVNPRTYPASYQPYVLAVGAVDQFGDVASFSESGSAKNTYYVGVTAPGVQVGGLLPSGKIAIDDGTSFAAPYVAAEAALIMQEHGWQGSGHQTAARAYEVMKIIEATAGGGGTYSPSGGWGEVDIQKALQTQVSDQLVAQPGDPIDGLPKLQGVGPLADGPVASTAADSRAVVRPYVAAAANKDAQDQQRWAYLALGAGLLIAVVALAGSAVARDAARRRGESRL